MRRSNIKRFLMITLVMAMLLTVYSPSAFCTSPSPTDSATSSPTDSATSSPTDSATSSPTDSDNADTDPTDSASAGPSMIKENDKGSEVVRLQMRLRELGYFNYRATGNFFSVTKNSVIDFQKNNDLGSDGRVGEQTYEKIYSTGDVARRTKSPSVTIIAGKQSQTPLVKGELGDWATINAAFAVSSTTTAKITDCVTQKAFYVYRTGGTNLAEVETATEADYATFKDCFGGKPTWERRGVVVTINGTDYAASLFGNPNGTDTLDSNGMTGHTTLYFNGSKSDVLGFADKEDMKQVLWAAGQPIQY